MMFFFMTWFLRRDISLEGLERRERGGAQNEILLYKGLEVAIRRYELFGNHVGEVSSERVS